jgi:hypothetical protein
MDYKSSGKETFQIYIEGLGVRLSWFYTMKYRNYLRKIIAKVELLKYFNMLEIYLYRNLENIYLEIFFIYV